MPLGVQGLFPRPPLNAKGPRLAPGASQAYSTRVRLIVGIGPDHLDQMQLLRGSLPMDWLWGR